MMTSLPLARVFQCLFAFAPFLLRTDWHEFDRSVDGEPQGNWRWNSNSRDVVASSPSFSLFSLFPAVIVHRRACSKVIKKDPLPSPLLSSLV